MKELLPALAFVISALLLSSCTEDEQAAVPSVSSITLTDRSNLGDGRDLELYFIKVPDESNVSGYRVYVVKSQNAGSFTRATAEALPSGQYTEVAADGTNKSFSLAQDARDTDGTLIAENQAYVLFVLTLGKGGRNELSKASSILTLTLPPTPTVGSVTVIDASNFGDGRDLRVIFNKVQDESLISGYRIFIVKASTTGSFSLSAAEAVPAANYTAVPKTGSNYNIELAQDTRDSDGDLILQNGQYAAFLLTAGADRNQGQNKLSNASNTLTLEIPAAPAVTNLVARDVSNNSNAKDIEVTFNKPANEAMIASYRIIVVKESSASNFDITKAEALTVGKYQAVPKSGNSQQLELVADQLDSDGSPIVELTNYKLYVVSIADGIVAGKNTLTASTGLLQLAQKNAVRTFAVFPNTGTGGLQVDNSGNVYFGDFGMTTQSPGTVVYRITPDGTASTFVTGLNTADGNDIDGGGNFYTISWNANQIIKVTPTGTKTVFASGGLINGPIGIAIDINSNLFVTNYNVNTIVKITPAGVVSAFSSSSLLDGPNGIDTDAAGNIYVSNWNDSRIIKLNKDTGAAELFVTTSGGNNAHLVIKNDFIYVAGRSSHQILRVSLSKEMDDFLGNGTPGTQNGPVSTATISWPNDIAFNANGTKMYISTANPATASGAVFGPAIIREVSLVE